MYRHVKHQPFVISDRTRHLSFVAAGLGAIDRFDVREIEGTAGLTIRFDRGSTIGMERTILRYSRDSGGQAKGR